MSGWAGLARVSSGAQIARQGTGVRTKRPVQRAPARESRENEFNLNAEGGKSDPIRIAEQSDRVQSEENEADDEPLHPIW